ncbi:hypothetical protein BQ8482_500027 [Mesorhizobium delmotii]|uniref:Uncharacterized protein n=1 Tax=Mesorhizobium delmotii TaxID=1631247 RepID=A0A2P9AUI4_9HYPH|nr:hypothetical protein BQ8482_500027 [Mesorhizobium delmotii]
MIYDCGTTDRPRKRRTGCERFARDSVPLFENTAIKLIDFWTSEGRVGEQELINRKILIAEDDGTVAFQLSDTLSMKERTSCIRSTRSRIALDVIMKERNSHHRRSNLASTMPGLGLEIVEAML